MDWLTFPFRAEPDLVFYMVTAVVVAGGLGVVVLGLIRLVQGPDRAREAVPYVRRVTLAWMVLAPLGVYLATFLVAFIVGAPFG